MVEGNNKSVGARLDWCGLGHGGDCAQMSIGEGELALLLLLLTLWVGPVGKAGDVAHCEVLLLSLKEGMGGGQTNVVGILLGSSKKTGEGKRDDNGAQGAW